MSKKYKPWTEKEDELLFTRLNNKDIAERLGRKEASVESRRNRLKYKKQKVKKGSREDRKLDFLVSLLILKNNNIKHKNTINGCLKAVRAGDLESLNIKIY